MSTEVWRPVHGFPLYEASSFGRVRRTATRQVLRVFWGKRDYGYVTLSRGTKLSRCTLGVHKVVALAFLGPCPPGKETAHRDHNPRRNVPGNLEYLTHVENMRDSAQAGRVHRGECHPRTRLTRIQVLAIRKRYRKFSRAHGTPQLAREYGVALSTVDQIVTRRTWSWL